MNKIIKLAMKTKLFSGTANTVLAERVSQHLQLPLAKMSVKRFADKEIGVTIEESVRGSDAYVLQSISGDVNSNLMELLLVSDALKRASVARITAVLLYMAYARQDRKKPLSARVPISAALISKLIEASGVNRVMTVDIHSPAIQGFFNVPVDVISSMHLLCDHILTLILDGLKKVVIVSPDAGGTERAQAFRKYLLSKMPSVEYAMVIKTRVEANKVASSELVGEVQDVDCIIVDDMIDTGGTLVSAANELKKHRCKRVFACAAHGLFNGDAVSLIEKSPIELVLVTDTVPLSDKAKICSKIHQVSIAPLLSDSIRRLSCDESISQTS